MSVHQALTYAAFGWLSFSGALHFIIDVVSQKLRKKREPSAATTLYYGLNTSFALGQVVFGLLCLWLARHIPAAFTQLPVIALCGAAATGWLVISFVFMGYREPKLNAAIFAILILAAVVTG